MYFTRFSYLSYLENTDMKEVAKDYLIRNGMNEQVIDLLIEKITK